MKITSIKTSIIRRGNDLFEIISKNIKTIPESSILVIAAKIVSICQSRLIEKKLTKLEKFNLIKFGIYYKKEDSMTFKELQGFVKKISEKFSEKEDIFDILARLMEECGELAAEVRKLEKKGSKVYFNIAGDKKKLADELVDVLNVIASIANFYDLDLDDETSRRNTHIKKVLKIEEPGTKK